MDIRIIQFLWICKNTDDTNSSYLLRIIIKYLLELSVVTSPPFVGSQVRVFLLFRVGAEDERENECHGLSFFSSSMPHAPSTPRILFFELDDIVDMT